MKLRNCWSIFYFVVLATTAKVSYGASEINIEQVCAISPVDCLTRVEAALAEKPANLIKFDLLQYRFDALFKLQKFPLLYQETGFWVKDKSTPIAFQITAAIYYAKTSLSYGTKEVSRKYSMQAQRDLDELNQIFPSPIRIIELANLQMLLGEHKLAYEKLTLLEKNYQRSRDPFLKMELYGNLGHITRHLGKYELSLEYWKKTLPWSIKNKNQQQQGVVLYNLAKAYYQLNKFEQAVPVLHEAKSLSLMAKDDVKAMQSHLLLIKTNIALNNKDKARKLFNNLDIEKLPAKMKLSAKEIKMTLSEID